MRLALSSVALLAFLVACSRSEPSIAQDKRPDDASASSPPSTGVSDSAAPPEQVVTGVVVSHPRVVEERGTVRLVLQQVEAVCIVGRGANGKGHFSVGTDLLLETVEEEGATSTREHVFCPKKLADGGPVAARLGIWRNCRRDQTCEVVSTDSGAGSVEVVCGKDHVTIETTSGRTILRGPSGEREIAPAPMKIAPPKRERRNAMVDC